MAAAFGMCTTLRPNGSCGRRRGGAAGGGAGEGSASSGGWARSANSVSRSSAAVGGVYGARAGEGEAGRAAGGVPERVPGAGAAPFA